MSQQELLTEVARTLDRLGIPYMLTGSHASSLYGQLRTTHDIDFVVRLSPANIPGLVQSFPAPRFYVSETAVREAIRVKRMFNVVEPATDEKIDFWVLRDLPFDQSRFSRRQSIDYAGQAISVCSPEDTILSKLVWGQESGGSEKQFNDALLVFELQAGLLDLEYIDHWVQRLGVDALWQRLRAEAEPFNPDEEPPPF